MPKTQLMVGLRLRQVRALWLVAGMGIAALSGGATHQASAQLPDSLTREVPARPVLKSTFPVAEKKNVADSAGLRLPDVPARDSALQLSPAAASAQKRMRRTNWLALGGALFLMATTLLLFNVRSR